MMKQADWRQTPSSINLSMSSMSSGHACKPPVSCRVFATAIVTSAILALVFGILIGNVALSRPNEDRIERIEAKLAYFEQLVNQNDGKWSQKLLRSISASRIRDFLRNLTEKAHLAGTQNDRIGAERIKRTWINHGLPNVKLNHYDVLLSYPDPENLNYVSILSKAGKVLFQTKLAKFTDADLDLGRKITPPFNAFSASGSIIGEIVFVNYGRTEDFKYITEDLGIDLNEKIVLLKYGATARGPKSLLAQNYNVSGVILYSDPKDYVLDNSGVYPKSLNLPPDGVQRGSLKRIRADPLTPGYPATENAHRISEKDAETINQAFTIPVFPIGYGDAAMLLNEIDGQDAPEEWKGGLNLTYKIGPGFKEHKKLKLNVGNVNKRKVISNVIGIIPGDIEPDRYVIVGNHRDSWTLGGSDPSSGTACLMEMTRVFGKLCKEGWQPRRTIIFASWDAEEYGYVGATEWAEEYRFILDRAVVYFNVDQAVTGTKAFTARGSPSVHEVIYNITKLVKNPDTEEMNRGRKNVYGTWSVRRSHDNDYIPPITYPSGGSDFYTFLHYFGVPVADFRFSGKKLSNPLYHTRFETFHMQDKLIDPAFKYHKALTEIWTFLAISFSEPPILPFNITGYIPILEKALGNLEEAYGELIEEIGLHFDTLEKVFKDFYGAILSFENFKNSRQTSENPFEIRMINDQMMRMERSFMSIENSIDRLNSLNVLMSVTKNAPGARLLFGHLGKSLWDTKEARTPQNLERVKKDFATLIFHIQSATLVLKQTHSL